jgi:hypothetical protein
MSFIDAHDFPAGLVLRVVSVAALALLGACERFFAAALSIAELSGSALRALRARPR